MVERLPSSKPTHAAPVSSFLSGGAGPHFQPSHLAMGGHSGGNHGGIQLP